MECLLIVDVVLVKVWKVDKVGNLFFSKIVCNFNLLVVMVGKVCVVEVEQIVEIGELEVDQIYLLGVYVQCLVFNVNLEKCIE